MAQSIHELQLLLQNLSAADYPELPSPQPTLRRASVALVLRIKPSYSHWPQNQSPKPCDLDAFFAQDWVQRGEPEVLFIKRAARRGDRWTSHIALPGGKRDAEDVDDKAAAVRETWEEVGLDLDKYAIDCEALPQRLVTTHWGKKPLLVLCPYVFILTAHEIPPLKLQPTEVAATHWVPLRCLQSPKSRTVVFEDVSTRLANQETGVKTWMLRLVLGKMMFAAINLLPSESLHSMETPVQDQLQDNRHAQISRLDGLRSLANRCWTSDFFGHYPPVPPEAPLMLWGLTLGVISDFLDLLPPHNALTLWSYPNFTPLDVRFAVWLLTYRFKDRKRAELQGGTEFLSRPSFGYATESLAHGKGRALSKPAPDSLSSTILVDRPNETGFHGLGTGSSDGHTRNKKALVATMLEGCVERLARVCLPAIADRARYYDIVRRAVALALLGRASVGALMVIALWRRFGRRR